MTDRDTHPVDPVQVADLDPDIVAALDRFEFAFRQAIAGPLEELVRALLPSGALVRMQLPFRDTEGHP